MSRRKVPTRWGPRWSRWVGRFLARVYWNTRVTGIEHVPRTGPVVLVANHIGFIDGPLVHGLVRRGSHFLIIEDMFRGAGGILGLLLRGAGQIPVSGAGREALAIGKAILDRGDVVGVFPEGTRGAGTADAVQGGAAWLALHTNATIVPVGIVGTRLPGESVNVWPRPRRRIIAEFGEPFLLDPPSDLKGRYRQEWVQSHVAQRLRTHVADVVSRCEIPLPGPS